MPATQTAQGRRTHCPTCGVKLPEQPLSLCAYCASPLDLMDQAQVEEGAESPNAGKIRKILESANYEEAFDSVPPETRAWQAARAQIDRARILFVVGPLVFLAGLALGSGSILTRIPTWGAVAILAYAIWSVVRAKANQKKETAFPLLKRPGVVLERRSETAIEGWSGHTIYYFKIELEGGVVAEFAYPGHGSSDEPYTNGLTGIAFTRGQSLLSFRHVRI